MGSIQGLRAEGLALRAKEDTNLQIAGHLGSVNKSLGSQIVGIIDQLQGIIGERTKAYNTSMIKLTQTINGKTDLGEKAMDVVFKTLGIVLSVAGGADSAHIASAIADSVAVVSDILGLRAEVTGAALDYEKGMSQLGYTHITPSDSSIPNTAGDQGAVRFLALRNSLMPQTPGSGTETISAGGTTRYLIGSLRRD